MDYNTRSQNNLQPFAVSIILTVLIILKVLGLFFTKDLMPSDDYFYLPRHIVYLLVWASLLYYFYNLHLLCKHESMIPRIVREQELAAKIACAACIIKGVWTLVHTFSHSFALNIFNSYYIVEAFAWFFFARYLYGSFRALRHMRKNMEEEYDLD